MPPRSSATADLVTPIVASPKALEDATSRRTPRRSRQRPCGSRVGRRRAHPTATVDKSPPGPATSASCARPRLVFRRQPRLQTLRVSANGTAVHKRADQRRPEARGVTILDERLQASVWIPTGQQRRPSVLAIWAWPCRGRLTMAAPTLGGVTGASTTRVWSSSPLDVVRHRLRLEPDPRQRPRSRPGPRRSSPVFASLRGASPTRTVPAVWRRTVSSSARRREREVLSTSAVCSRPAASGRPNIEVDVDAEDPQRARAVRGRDARGGLAAPGPAPAPIAAGDRRADAPVEGKVGIATGGGSGHLPVFMGYVGRGLIDGAAIGNVFASPAERRHARRSPGRSRRARASCTCTGTTAATAMNFDLAAELAADEGIEVRRSSAPTTSPPRRRTWRARARGDRRGSSSSTRSPGAWPPRARRSTRSWPSPSARPPAPRTMGVALRRARPAAGVPHSSCRSARWRSGWASTASRASGAARSRPPTRSPRRVGRASRTSQPRRRGRGPGEHWAPHPRRSCTSCTAGSDPRAEAARVHRLRVGEYATSLEMAGAADAPALDDELRRLVDRPPDSRSSSRRSDGGTAELNRRRCALSWPAPATWPRLLAGWLERAWSAEPDLRAVRARAEALWGVCSSRRLPRTRNGCCIRYARCAPGKTLIAFCTHVLGMGRDMVGRIRSLAGTHARLRAKRSAAWSLVTRILIFLSGDPGGNLPDFGR